VTVHPSAKNLVKQFVRQSWPKRQPRTRRPRGEAKAAIAAIRRAEMSVAQGARQLGCDRTGLGRRIWEETKADVIVRDGGCVVCGSATGLLDVHHRDARGMGGTADPAIAFGMANLVTLCRADHSYIEQHPDWAREGHLRLDAGEIPAEVPVLYRGALVLLTDDGRVEPAEGGAA
jgi:hypothetical protein